MTGHLELDEPDEPERTGAGGSAENGGWATVEGEVVVAETLVRLGPTVAWEWRGRSALAGSARALAKLRAAENGGSGLKARRKISLPASPKVASGLYSKSD